MGRDSFKQHWAVLTDEIAWLNNKQKSKGHHPIITTGFGLATIGGITWFFFYRTRNLVYATQALVGSNFIENLLTPTDQMPHPNGVARPQTRFSSFVLLGAQAGGALFLIKIIISGLRH